MKTQLQNNSNPVHMIRESLDRLDICLVSVLEGQNSKVILEILELILSCLDDLKEN